MLMIFTPCVTIAVSIQNKGLPLKYPGKIPYLQGTKTGVILNDNYADFYNPLFELVTTVFKRVKGGGYSPGGRQHARP
jgi:hypothetical protein